MNLKFCYLFFFLFLLGCDKSTDYPETGHFRLEVAHEVDSAPLVLDSMGYHNAAGNEYEVTLLEYYISDLTFYTNRGNVYSWDTSLYVKAEEDKMPSWDLPDMPTTGFEKLEFYVGIPPERNGSGQLPSTIENYQMAWPDQMGGGYHFLRFEGHYQDTNGTQGFAFHLGKDPNLVKISLVKPFRLAYKGKELNLIMNLNEWFKGIDGEKFDLLSGPNYTMSNDSAMERLAEYGKGAWSITN